MSASDSKDLQKLKACLSAARVFEDLIDWIVAAPPEGLGFESLEDLFYSIDTTSYEQGTRDILDKHVKYKEDCRALSRLRSAWKQAKKAIDLESSSVRKTSGKDGESEEPIPEKEAEGLAARWLLLYHLEMSIYLRPADSLLAKLWREVQRNEHTVHVAKKIRSIFQATLPNQEESVGLKPGVTLEFDKEQSVDPRTVVEYYVIMRILAYAYAYCGSHEVASVRSKELKVVFAPLDVNLDYADEALRYADARPGSQEDKMRWLQKRDEATRGAMVGYMRRGWPQGEALTQSRLEQQIEWKLTIPSLQLGQQEKDRSRSPKRGRDYSPPKATRAPNQRQNLCDTFNNALICKKHNDSRGCSYAERDCPMQRAHVCDIDVGGRPCGSRKHRRNECPHRI